jgi:glucose-6-phosphate dehydrogenase assembly protein OpcA
MSEAQIPFPAMRPVQLDSIERELDNLWRKANEQVALSGGVAYSRNSVLTLVAYTTSIAQANHVLTIAHQLTSQHPSRAIVIAADPEAAGSEISAYVGAHVGAEGSSYGEDIVITVEAEAIQHLPGVVLPFVVSGLPSFLWWMGEPSWGSALLEALVDGCDRLIVDTSEMAHPQRSLAALEDLILRKQSRCAVSDIGWAYQQPWREIVAQFFDPVPLRPYLDGIERVAIEFAAGAEDEPPNMSQAYLFAGWLASRLGWRPTRTAQDGTGASQSYTFLAPAGQRVTLDMHARFGVPLGSWWDPAHVEADAQSDDSAASAELRGVRRGALMSVHIASNLEGAAATFTVARERDLQHATTMCRVPQGAPPTQTVHLRSLGEQALLAEQLETLGHTGVYEEAMAIAAQLAGQPLRGVR